MSDSLDLLEEEEGLESLEGDIGCLSAMDLMEEWARKVEKDNGTEEYECAEC